MSRKETNGRSFGFCLTGKVSKLKLLSCHSRKGLGIFQLGRNGETHLPVDIVSFKSLIHSEWNEFVSFSYTGSLVPTEHRGNGSVTQQQTI